MQNEAVLCIEYVFIAGKSKLGCDCLIHPCHFHQHKVAGSEMTNANPLRDLQEQIKKFQLCSGNQWAVCRFRNVDFSQAAGAAKTVL